jgi:beta-lactamase class A
MALTSRQANVEVNLLLDDLFAEAGVTGFLHARDLGTGRDVSHRGNELVVAASVFKISVLLELARRIERGDVDPLERLRIEPAGRAPGPTGLSAFQDAVELSVRDAALSMMSVSDNATTDVLMETLGLEAVNADLQRLGLRETVLVGDCRTLFSSLSADTGATTVEEFYALPPEQLARWRVLDPVRTTRTTPENTTRLLELIWADEAAGPGACAYVRKTMAAQVWPHRLRSAFDSSVHIAAKTGTLAGIRNEAGVIELPSGRRFAVAVFTREASFAPVLPHVDAVIGRAARLAVDWLSATPED